VFEQQQDVRDQVRLAGRLEPLLQPEGIRIRNEA
jgi:hypothetical protein